MHYFSLPKHWILYLSKLGKCTFGVPYISPTSLPHGNPAVCESYTYQLRKFWGPCVHGDDLLLGHPMLIDPTECIDGLTPLLWLLSTNQNTVGCMQVRYCCSLCQKLRIGQHLENTCYCQFINFWSTKIQHSFQSGDIMEYFFNLIFFYLDEAETSGQEVCRFICFFTDQFTILWSFSTILVAKSDWKFNLVRFLFIIPGNAPCSKYPWVSCICCMNRFK